MKELFEKLKTNGIEMRVKYYEQINGFAFIFEKCSKSWSVHVGNSMIHECMSSVETILENELDKLLTSGYFNLP